VLKNIPGALPSSITSAPAGEHLGKYLSWQQAVTTSKKAGAAGETGVGDFDQFSKEQIALSVIPTQLRNSDTELKRYLEGIRQGLAEGKTPYEVADQLTGYKIDKPDAFSNSLRQYMAIANLSSSEISNVARLVNSGNKAGALAVVENSALNSQKKNDPDSYVGEATPRYYTEKVKEIKDLIAGAGLTDAIGPIEGSVATVFNKLPLTARAKSAKIQAKITSLVSEMRNHLSGTAVTDSEKKFLEPLIAKLSDKEGVFMAKIDELAGDSLLKHNETRKSAGLPEINSEQLVDRNKRIQVYSSGVSSDNNPIDREAGAEEKVISVYSKYQKTIDYLLAKNPGLSNADILEALGITY
jgi:hypothetical protein